MGSNHGHLEEQALRAWSLPSSLALMSPTAPATWGLQANSGTPHDICSFELQFSNDCIRRNYATQKQGEKPKSRINVQEGSRTPSPASRFSNAAPRASRPPELCHTPGSQPKESRKPNMLKCSVGTSIPGSTLVPGSRKTIASQQSHDLTSHGT